MNTYEVTASIDLHQSKIHTAFVDKSLYIKQDNTSLFIHPCVPETFLILDSLFDEGLRLYMTGNNIGSLRVGGHNKEGEGQHFSLKSVGLHCNYYKTGIEFKVSITTNIGKPILQGGIDFESNQAFPAITRQLVFFVPVSDLSSFLKKSKEQITTDTKVQHFTESLRESGPD